MIASALTGAPIGTFMYRDADTRRDEQDAKTLAMLDALKATSEKGNAG